MTTGEAGKLTQRWGQKSLLNSHLDIAGLQNNLTNRRGILEEDPDKLAVTVPTTGKMTIMQACRPCDGPGPVRLGGLETTAITNGSNVC